MRPNVFIPWETVFFVPRKALYKKYNDPVTHIRLGAHMADPDRRRQDGRERQDARADERI